MKNLSQKKNKFIKFKIAVRDFLVVSLWEYIFILASIALCAWLFDKWIEACMFIVSHTCIRNSFDKQFHFNKTAYCLSLTMAIIWFAIPVTLPITVSLLASIPISFIISILGFIAQDRVDLLAYKRERTKIALSTLTETQLTEICNALGYNKIKTDLARMFFIEKLTNKQVWERQCANKQNVEWDTITIYKYRITKDFKNYINSLEEE